MKPFLSYALLAAAAAAGVSFGQTTASTTPVGYVSVGNSGAAPAGSDTYISLPLERAAEFSGQASGPATATTISLTGAAFTVDQWKDDADTPPYLLKIESGAKSGTIALIASNAAGTVTVDPSFDLTGVVATDKVTIRKAWTLKALFTGTTLPVSGLQLFAFDGAEVGINTQPNNSWAWDGTNWTNNLTLDIDDDAVLYPGEALVVRNASGTPITAFTVTGEVATAKSLVTIRGGATQQDTPISFVSSVGEPVITSGISAVAAIGDTILVIPNDLVALNKAASKTFTYDGTGWSDSDTLDYIDNTVKFEAGVSYIYRRAAGAPTVNWSDLPDYVSSL